MAKMADFECNVCGEVFEWFDDEGDIPCVNEECKGKMSVVFSPKRNQQRARVNDLVPFKMPS